MLWEWNTKVPNKSWSSAKSHSWQYRFSNTKHLQIPRRDFETPPREHRPKELKNMKLNENEIFISSKIVAHPGRSRITNHTQTSTSCCALSPHPLTCNSVTSHTNRRKALLWGTGWRQLCGDFHGRSKGKSNHICTRALTANLAEALHQEHTRKSQTRAHAEDKRPLYRHGQTKSTHEEETDPSIYTTMAG